MAETIQKLMEKMSSQRVGYQQRVISIWKKNCAHLFARYITMFLIVPLLSDFSIQHFSSSFGELVLCAVSDNCKANIDVQR